MDTSAFLLEYQQFQERLWPDQASRMITNNGLLDAFRSLLEKGWNPTVKINSDLTQLHWAVKGDSFEIAELLLIYGANPNDIDDDGQTPLHYAVKHRNGGLLQLLLEYRANPNAKDNLEATPLHYAVQAASLIVARLLLDSGANTLASDMLGATPLDDAKDEMRALLRGDEVSHSKQVM